MLGVTHGAALRLRSLGHHQQKTAGGLPRAVKPCSTTVTVGLSWPRVQRSASTGISVRHGPVPASGSFSAIS
jgi:hypothetical protein